MGTRAWLGWAALAGGLATGACTGNRTHDDAATTCPTPNPALACRATADQCIPTACGCGGDYWTCTGDCGGGQACADAGEDAGGKR